MQYSQDHEGTYEALLGKLNHFSINDAEALKTKVDQGHCLNEFELEHVKELIEMARQLKQLQVQDHRNHQLPDSFISLISKISQQALANQKANPYDK
jgi:hypothetical protein